MSRLTRSPLARRARRAARAALSELRTPPKQSAPAPARPARTTVTAATPPRATTPDPSHAEDSRADAAPTVSARHSPVPVLDLTVAVAAGDHLGDLLAPEWTQRHLDPGSWRGQLPGADLLLLEGAQGSVPGWGDEGALTELLAAAEAAALPVAVWVTDDVAPGEWADRATTIGASSARALAALAAAGRTAHHWPPAAQLRSLDLARPDATTQRRSGALAVVGTPAPEGDSSPLRLLADAVAPMKKGLVRVVRLPGADSALELPAGLTVHAGRVGPGDASVLLDLSAVSPAGAWTTVAAAAARTPVVGTAAATDLPTEVEGLVPRVDNGKHLRGELVARIHQEELAAREGLRLHRAVLDGHTAAHRGREIARAAGLDVPSIAAATVSAIVPTNRAHQLDNVFAYIGHQTHPATELVLVLHGLDTDDADLRRRAADAGVEQLQILHADASLTLGACMNLGIDAAGGQYIAKMDDDNVYGPRYLADLMACFTHTDAGIVGKWAHYVWLQSTGAVVLRYPDSEHRYERRIQGGSMLFAGDVVRGLRFSNIPRAVDSDILDRALAQDVQVYSGDRFNYVSVRGDNPNSHTWTVADSTFFTASGRLVFYGDPTTHVTL